MGKKPVPFGNDYYWRSEPWVKKIVVYKRKPKNTVKRSKEELRAEKLALYSETHGIELKYLYKVIELYLKRYPDKVTCAGNVNGSNRFIEACLQDCKNIDVVEELKRLDHEAKNVCVLSDEERTEKINSFCRLHLVTPVEVENAVDAYLSKYPDKIGTEGHKHLSQRFLRACMRAVTNDERR